MNKTYTLSLFLLSLLATNVIAMDPSDSFVANVAEEAATAAEIGTAATATDRPWTHYLLAKASVTGQSLQSAGRSTLDFLQREDGPISYYRRR